MSLTHQQHSFARSVKLAGLVMIFGGFIGAGLTYRSMRTENLMHAKTGIIALDLSGTDSTTRTERFHLYRSGQHRLFFTVLDPVAEGSEDTIISAEKDRFQGQVTIQVSDPTGKVISSETVTPDETEIWRPRGAGWIVLDTLEIVEPTESPWTITAQVAAGDSNFATVQTEVFILPPQPYEIGSFLSVRVYVLAGMCGLVVIGFIMLAASSASKKQSS